MATGAAQKMSQPNGQESKLSGIQKLIVATTFLGTLGLSIANRPAVAFGIVGLGTLLLLLFGSDIARVTVRLLGGEAIIERAERAEHDALKAAQEAKSAVAEVEKTLEALRQLGMHLSSAVLVLDVSQGIGLMRQPEAAVKGRDVVRDDLRAMGCKPEDIDATLKSFNNMAALGLLNEVAQAVAPEEARRIVREMFAKVSVQGSFQIEEAKATFAQYVEMTPELSEVLEEVIKLEETGEADFSKMRKLRGV